VASSTVERISSLLAATTFHGHVAMNAAASGRASGATFPSISGLSAVT
jgi:hypothetical protein